VPSPAASERPRCPPALPSRQHCVYLTLAQATQVSAEKVAKKLRTDGVESEISEEHQLAVSLTDAQLQAILGAKVSYSLTGASASDRLICDVRIASFAAPQRYREIASVRIDPACP